MWSANLSSFKSRYLLTNLKLRANLNSKTNVINAIISCAMLLTHNFNNFILIYIIQTECNSLFGGHLQIEDVCRNVWDVRSPLVVLFVGTDVVLHEIHCCHVKGLGGQQSGVPPGNIWKRKLFIKLTFHLQNNKFQ